MSFIANKGIYRPGPGEAPSMLRPKTREYQLYQLKPTAPDPGPDVRIDMASEV